MAIGVYYELCIHWFFHDFEIGIFSVLFFTFFCTLAPFGSFPLWCLIYPWFLFWDFLYFFHLFCILAPFGSFLLWCRSLQPDSSLIALFRSRVWSPLFDRDRNSTFLVHLFSLSFLFFDNDNPLFDRDRNSTSVETVLLSRLSF